jgi:hypothetical protein
VFTALMKIPSEFSQAWSIAATATLHGISVFIAQANRLDDHMGGDGLPQRSAPEY